jgi:hypothetical protein
MIFYEIIAFSWLYADLRAAIRLQAPKIPIMTKVATRDSAVVAFATLRFCKPKHKLTSPKVYPKMPNKL